MIYDREEDVMATRAAEAPLARVRVVDLTTSLGEYAGRILADLGADVLRVDDDDPHRQRHSRTGTRS